MDKILISRRTVGRCAHYQEDLALLFVLRVRAYTETDNEGKVEELVTRLLFEDHHWVQLRADLYTISIFRDLIMLLHCSMKKVMRRRSRSQLMRPSLPTNHYLPHQAYYKSIGVAQR